MKLETTLREGNQLMPPGIYRENISGDIVAWDCSPIPDAYSGRSDLLEIEIPNEVSK